MYRTVGSVVGSGAGRAVEFGADPAEHLVILRSYSDLDFTLVYIYCKSLDPAVHLVILFGVYICDKSSDSAEHLAHVLKLSCSWF